jgi:hypothetical protein
VGVTESGAEAAAGVLPVPVKFKRPWFKGKRDNKI